MCLPALAFLAVAGYATGAGCYAWTMNCFSITVANDGVSRAVLFGAAFMPYALAAYAPVFAFGWIAIQRGSRAWPVFAPPLFALCVHLACLWLAPLVLPDRRVTPSLRLDLNVLLCSIAYCALAWLAIEKLGLFQPKVSPWQQRELSRSK